MRTASLIFFQILLFALPIAGGPITIAILAGASGGTFYGSGIDADIRALYTRSNNSAEPASIIMSPVYGPDAAISFSSVINNSLSLSLDLWYRAKGIAYAVPGIVADSLLGVISNRSIRLDYLTVPLRATVYLPGYSIFFPYAYAGLFGGILLDVNAITTGARTENRYGYTGAVASTEQIPLGDYFNWYDAGVSFGVGMELGLGIRGIVANLGCEWGLVDIVNHPQNNELFTDAMSTLSIGLAVGYEIRLFRF